MDPDKRARLEVLRHGAQKARADMAARAELAPAIEALDAEGDGYELLQAGELPSWSPSWLPSGVSTVPWDRLQPDVWQQFAIEPDRDGKRATSARDILSALIDDETPILVIYDGYASSLRLTPAVACRQMSALIAVPSSSIWFAAPPRNWLVDVQRDQIFARRK